MKNANLANAQLKAAILSECDCRSVNLKGADLDRATLSGADITGADLTQAQNLDRADFTCTNITEIKYDIDNIKLRDRFRHAFLQGTPPKELESMTLPSTCKVCMEKNHDYLKENVSCDLSEGPVRAPPSTVQKY
jgi:uncharacterized protein YjbI with pentapeptide repeats